MVGKITPLLILRHPQHMQVYYSFSLILSFFVHLAALRFVNTSSSQLNWFIKLQIKHEYFFHWD